MVYIIINIIWIMFWKIIVFIVVVVVVELIYIVGVYFIEGL